MTVQDTVSPKCVVVEKNFPAKKIVLQKAYLERTFKLENSE